MTPCDFHIGYAKERCRRCGASLAAHYGLPDPEPDPPKRRRVRSDADAMQWHHAHESDE